VRILLCDNHRLLVEALAGALRRGGHDVVAMATQPEEALHAAAEQDPDVCLLDVIFPGGAGIATITGIRDDCATAELTEPNKSPANPPRPRLPTTNS